MVARKEMTAMAVATSRKEMKRLWMTARAICAMMRAARRSRATMRSGMDGPTQILQLARSMERLMMQWAVMATQEGMVWKSENMGLRRRGGCGGGSWFRWLGWWRHRRTCSELLGGCGLG